jgi:hypothetical protein
LSLLERRLESNWPTKLWGAKEKRPSLRGTLIFERRSVQTHRHVEQSMKRLGAFGQLSQARLFQRPRKRVEQAPHVARFKRLVLGPAPFAEHIGNVGVRTPKGRSFPFFLGIYTRRVGKGWHQEQFNLLGFHASNSAFGGSAHVEFNGGSEPCPSC